MRYVSTIDQWWCVANCLPLRWGFMSFKWTVSLWFVTTSLFYARWILQSNLQLLVPEKSRMKTATVMVLATADLASQCCEGGLTSLGGRYNSNQLSPSYASQTSVTPCHQSPKKIVLKYQDLRVGPWFFSVFVLDDQWELVWKGNGVWSKYISWVAGCSIHKDIFLYPILSLQETLWQTSCAPAVFSW